jgi:hypothetical protein
VFCSIASHLKKFWNIFSVVQANIFAKIPKNDSKCWNESSALHKESLTSVLYFYFQFIAIFSSIDLLQCNLLRHFIQLFLFQSELVDRLLDNPVLCFFFSLSDSFILHCRSPWFSHFLTLIIKKSIRAAESLTLSNPTWMTQGGYAR